MLEHAIRKLCDFDQEMDFLDAKKNNWESHSQEVQVADYGPNYVKH